MNASIKEVILWGVQIRGILPDEEKKIVEYSKEMPVGSFDDLKPGEFDIILGQDLAETLDVKVGEKITVVTPEGNMTTQIGRASCRERV